jgi:heme exporter protein D
VDQLSTYLAMGGYAAFVWPSYGFAALVMAGLALASRRALSHSARQLAALEAGDRGDRRARRAAPQDPST